MRRRRQDEARGQETAELAARVAASSELADQLAEQRRAVALVRSAAAEVEAPAALRARIEAQRRARRVRAPRRFVVAAAALTAVLAVAIGIAVLESGDSTQRF